MYEQEVIIVPILLLSSFLVTLVFIILLRVCPERVDRIRLQAIDTSLRTQRSRRVLHGIDGERVTEDAAIGLNEIIHIIK